MGTATSPGGPNITFDSVSFFLNGVPWTPIIGEVQSERIPAATWRDELLKVKAGGVNTVGLYTFWIHHQETGPNQPFDWTGNNDLRTFVTLAGDVGLKVFLRIGPWSHGENHNGGFPDWLVQTPGITLRSNTTLFMSYVKPFYEAIAAQIDGLLWHQGGPVVSIQVDNEYGGSADYLLALKQVAIDAGIDVPTYMKTGWPAEPWPFGSLLAMSGGYEAEFWSRQLKPDNTDCFLFRNVSLSDQYPSLAVELGGGMETSYHRRIAVTSTDIAAGSMVALGSGFVQLGYYIYHGATQRQGNLTTLQEWQGCSYAGSNDMPVRSYDFYAPIGEAGQTRGHYHSLRAMHTFVATWDAWFTRKPSVLPVNQPAGSDDFSVLRWAMRADPTGGILFVNNYQLNQTAPQALPAFNGTQFQITTSAGTVAYPPTGSMDVPAGAFFWLPWNMPVPAPAVATGGPAPLLVIAYGTASPLTYVPTGNADGSLLVLFGAVAGVGTELGFNLTATGATLASCGTGATCHTDSGLVVVDVAQPGLAASATFTAATGATVIVAVLDANHTTALWTAELGGQTRAFVTSGAPFDGLLFDPATPNAFRLRTQAAGSTASVSIYPPPVGGLQYGGAALPSSADGLFVTYSLQVPPPAAAANWTLVAPAGPARVVPIGPAGAASGPNEDGGFSDWAHAAAYDVLLQPTGGDSPPPFPPFDLRLRITYTGDAGRVYVPSPDHRAPGANLTMFELWADNFYNGRPWEMPLRELGARPYTAPLRLLLLPLRRDAPIFLQQWPAFGPTNTTLELVSVGVVQTLDAELTVGGGLG